MPAARKKKPLAVVENNPPPQEDAGALMTIISRAALDPTFDVEKLSALLTVKERWDAEEARRAFIVAKAAFRGSATSIIKNQQVKFGTTEYMHATLDAVAETIQDALVKNGFDYAWKSEQDTQAGQITVTCCLTHVGGHSECATLISGLDTSGGKNNIQALVSAQSYLKRHTLLSVTGMATKEADDDGAAAGGFSTITDDQYEKLVALQKEVNADTARFLKHFGIETLDMLPANQYNNAVRALEKKGAAA